MSTILLVLYLFFIATSLYTIVMMFNKKVFPIFGKLLVMFMFSFPTTFHIGNGLSTLNVDSTIMAIILILYLIIVHTFFIRILFDFHYRKALGYSIAGLLVFTLFMYTNGYAFGSSSISL